MERCSLTLSSPNANKKLKRGRYFQTIHLGGSKEAVIGYVRVSSDGQLQGNSPEAQKEWIMEGAKRLGAQEVILVTDAGLSGQTTEKRQLSTILKLAKEKKSTVLMVREVDRVGRNFRNATRFYLDYFEAGGTLIRTSTFDYDGSSTSLIFFVINAITAEKSVQSNSYAWKRSKIQAIRSGVWKGPIPFGYVQAGEGIKKDPALVPVILDLFAEFLRVPNYSLTGQCISAKYPNLDIQLDRHAVKRVLSNPIYAGMPKPFEDGERLPDLAFVDVEMFKNVMLSQLAVFAKHKAHKNGPFQEILKSHPMTALEFIESFVDWVHKGDCQGRVVEDGTKTYKGLKQQIFLCQKCGDTCIIPTVSQAEALSACLTSQDERPFRTSGKRANKIKVVEISAHGLDQFFPLPKA